MFLSGPGPMHADVECGPRALRASRDCSGPWLSVEPWVSVFSSLDQASPSLKQQGKGMPDSAQKFSGVWMAREASFSALSFFPPPSLSQTLSDRHSTFPLSQQETVLKRVTADPWASGLRVWLRLTGD